MPDLPARLREALGEAGFTFDAVAGLLGARAHEALGRNETTPGLSRTGDGSPLATLTRLFVLQAEVLLADVERALPGLVPDLVGAGFVTTYGERVRALLDCRPYATEARDLWVVSDLTPGLDGRPVEVTADHVLGISPASTSLAQLTIREPVSSALDLGTGCGVQALHLAEHAGRVVATDVNERALELTRFTLALNAIDGVDVRAGSLLEPVAGEAFDLIATNPPFVISPPGGERLVYRDSGLPGDAVVERIVREAPRHLAEGGWCQVLANWMIADEPWDERLGRWLADDCDALVVQREVMDPAAYVELWLKDAGLHGVPDYPQRYDSWLRWLDEQGVTGIGFGWVNLHRTGSAHRELVDWPYAVEQPIAPAVAAWGAAVGRSVTRDDRLVARADVLQETTGAPGAADPEAVVLRQQTGLRRARRADTVEAALVGACDGDLSLGQILDALATLLDRDANDLHDTYLPVVAELVHEGFLS